MQVRRTLSVPGTQAGTRHVSHGKPDWLKEWVENNGNWVRLECGHYEDLHDKTLLVIYATKAEILCERCGKWSAKLRRAKFHEVAGIKPEIIPPEPLF